MSHKLDDVRVTEQAAQWLGRLLDGPEAHEAFFAWLAESPRHVEEFLYVLADAQDLAVLSSESRERIEALARKLGGTDRASANVMPISQSALASYDGEDSGEALTASLRRPGARLSGRWMTAIGAAAACVAGLVLWVTGPGAWSTYSTSVGEQRTLELQDGSIVHLNTNSRIAVRFSKDARQVRLVRGEALFRVEHEAHRTFSVHAADAVIQAIGTQFDVYRNAGGTQVAVIDGLVQITHGEAPVEFPRQPLEPGQRTSGSAALLAAGEAATVSAAGVVSRHQDSDVGKAVAWRQRRLVFEDDTLGDIAAEFNRYNARVKIRVEDEAARQQHFSGTFDADAPEAMMLALGDDPTLEVERRGHEILIRNRGGSAGPATP